MKALILVSLMIFIPAHATPLTDLKEVGKTEMNWLFWKLYDIRLLSADGQYHPQKYPVALAIRYARDFSAEQLLSSTIDEWSRQQINWKTSWQDALRKMWPDVAEGDEIILRVDQNRHSQFYFNDQNIGTIEDEQFAPAFLSIWLSDNTLKPELRNRLIKRITGTL
jgi:hypothetical protein